MRPQHLRVAAMHERTLFFAIFLATLVPAGHAAAPSSEEVLMIPQDDGKHVYVTVCRGDDVSPSPAGLVDDCRATGIWTESNGIPGLQTRAGMDGNRIYSADTRHTTLP